MFYNCFELSFINLDNFNTSNVNSMTYMFHGCNRLKTLNLSSFNISEGTDMNNIFPESIEKIIVNDDKICKYKPETAYCGSE